MLIVNPKRVHESIEVKPFWYNYYAGYSHTFTQKIIESAELQDSAVILDPWNGAGTTTLMASVNGFQSIGVDLNPAMRVIASAKQAVKHDIMLVNQNLKKVNAKVKVSISGDDLLNIWFEQASIESIRKIEHCILEGVKYDSTIEKVNSLNSAQCLMYTGLFNCVRGYLSSFIPSNPTWIKKPTSNKEKIKISYAELKEQYISYVKDMVEVMCQHFSGHKFRQIV